MNISDDQIIDFDGISFEAIKPHVMSDDEDDETHIAEAGRYHMTKLHQHQMFQMKWKDQRVLKRKE